MQELVSFISIMLGVVVLTAWVMWILLRPSGDSKAQEFASKSARDGLTEAVMENNELKNKVTRLERELKVLMNAGYKTSTDAKDDGLKTKVERQEERGKVKGERLKGKEEKSRSVVPGAMVSDKGAKIKDQELKTKAEPARAKVKGREEKSRSVVPGAMVLDERSKSNKVQPMAQKNVAKAEQARGKVKGKGEKTGVGALPVGGTSRGEDSSRMKNEGGKAKVVQQKVHKKVQKKAPKKVAKADVAAAKPVDTIQSSTVVPLSEAQRVTDAAEKKKIADYLASVAETTERQKMEVEALEEVSRHPDDDLKKIKGIGPHLEGKLKKAGISSYLQIAGFNENDIRHVSEVIGSYPRRIRREAWVEQAKVLVNKG